MLLSFNQLLELVELGIVTNVSKEMVNGTSIDVTLGKYLLLESTAIQQHKVSLRGREPLKMKRYEMNDNGYVLSPGEFVLAQSEQVFNLPLHISAEYKLKSSLARVGLEHLSAGWCDAGWHDSVLTLELINCTKNHGIHIRQGDRIGQMVFFKHEPVPMKNSYTKIGRYNGDSIVMGCKV